MDTSEILARLRRVSPGPRDVPDAADIEAAYHRVLARAEALRHVAAAHAPTRYAAKSWLWASGAGLAGLLIFAVGRIRTAAETSLPVATSAREYATKRAQRATVELPDGTVAQLAPETSLRYAVTSDGARHIEMRGEVFFTVRHDPARSFTIRSGPATTRVLGTAFSVRHYAADPVVQVAVVSGKVSTGTARRQVVVTPGLMARVADSVVAADRADVHDLTAWTEGRLVFMKVPVSAVIDAVSRWSGYDIRVADSSLVAGRVSTTLTVGNPREMTQLLAELLDATMTVEGTTITLHARKNPRALAPVRRELRLPPIPSPEVGK